MESKLIKKFLPPYNIASRDGKSPFYIHITSEKFPKPIVNHESKKALAGPFLSGQVARQILKRFRHIAPYHTESPCFYRHLGLCRPCPDDPLTRPENYLANISRLRRLLRGQFKQVMRQAIKTLDFETAASLRNLLYQPISPEEYVVNPNLVADRRYASLEALRLAIGIWPLSRIEMYDVANLSGTAATAAMTVAIDGEIDSRNFRHFTIQASGPNDVAMLKEALTRRLKRTDWPTPNLIVLDGGKSQLSIVNFPLPIPTIALAKKEEVIYTPVGKVIRLSKDHPGLQLLMRLRDEAPRFSRRLHHKHRKIV